MNGVLYNVKYRIRVLGFQVCYTLAYAAKSRVMLQPVHAIWNRFLFPNVDRCIFIVSIHSLKNQYTLNVYTCSEWLNLANAPCKPHARASVM